VLEIGRLEHEVVGAEPRRAHRVLDRAVPGQHHHRQRRVHLAQPAQHLHSVLVGQLQVEHHHVHLVVAQPLERLALAGGLEGKEAGVARPLAEREAQRALIVDDQDGAGALRLGGSLASGHAVSPWGS